MQYYETPPAFKYLAPSKFSIDLSSGRTEERFSRNALPDVRESTVL